MALEKGLATLVGPARYMSARSLGYVATSVLAALFVAFGAAAQLSMGEGNDGFAQCESITSLEKRLLMERWARGGACERPSRVRFTDGFLGYTCVVEGGTNICRSFVPGTGSEAFDTAQVFRCVDVTLTETDDGTVLRRNRMTRQV